MLTYALVLAVMRADAGVQPLEWEVKKRKLWSRLYSLLHRAVDDLYVLCEVDGNVEQTRNVIQLLDESTADFRQLQTRLRAQEEYEQNEGRRKGIAWPVRQTQTSPQ